MQTIYKELFDISDVEVCLVYLSLFFLRIEINLGWYLLIYTMDSSFMREAEAYTALMKKGN